MAQMSEGYVPGSAYFDFRQMREADTQSQQKTQLQNLDIARQQMEQAEAQRNLPLLEQQRRLKMGDVGGQLAKQPDVLSREAAMAAGAAAPGRVSSDIEGLDLESQAKVRAAKLKQQVDEMDVVARALDPVMTAAKRGDIRGANDTMEQAFDEMEKANVPGVAQWRLMPRDKALEQLQGHYNYAINNAPAIRERIKTEAAQKHAVELANIAARSREKVAAARIAAERPVNTTDAAGARLLEKYHKDPDSLTEANKLSLRAHLENVLLKNDPDLADRWEERAIRLIKIEKDQRFQQNKAMSPAETLEKIDSYIKAIRTKYMKDTLQFSYAKLYGKEPSPQPSPEQTPGTLIGKTPDGRNVYRTPDGKQVVQ